MEGYKISMRTLADYITFELGYGIHYDLMTRLLPDIKDERHLQALCTVDRTRRSLLQLYWLFPKIEELDKEEKADLKQYVIANFTGTTQWLVDTCKCIYTINQLLNLKQ